VIISTSGRFSDSRPAVSPEPAPSASNVLADLGGEFAAGQRGVAEVQDRPVPVALQCADEQMPGVDGMPQEIVTHARQTRTCSSLVTGAVAMSSLEE
jgi:hypothetical protein